MLTRITTTRNAGVGASRPASRPASRTLSRATTAARDGILAQLKDDHQRVKTAYRDFQKLDVAVDPQNAQDLVLQVLGDLTVHAALEEELLYPAARGALTDPSLVDEAEVEHASVRALIQQLLGMSPDEPLYADRFTLLCACVLHHVNEEERALFPQLEGVRVDWVSMASEMALRREALLAAEAPPSAAALPGAGLTAGRRSNGAGSRRV